MLIISFDFRCTLRFPSTNIKIAFQSLVNDDDIHPKRVPSPQPPKRRAPPLRINIPEQDSNTFSSPFPSPTGTIR